MSEKKKMTNLELVLTAQPAALKAIGLTSDLERDAHRLEAWKAAGHDALDYKLWCTLYEDEYAAYMGAAKVPTPSQAAANEAARIASNNKTQN